MDRPLGRRFARWRFWLGPGAWPMVKFMSRLLLKGFVRVGLHWLRTGL
jgi:hypothetical protein